MPPPLPRELVEQILSDATLGPVDLARTCLLSKDYLEYGRQNLYRQVRLSAVELEALQGAASNIRGRLSFRRVHPWRLSETSKHLMNTLRTTSVSRYVQHVAIEAFDYYMDYEDGVPNASDEACAGASGLISSILELATSIKSFDAPETHDWSESFKGWLDKPARQRLDRVDLPQITAETWDVLRRLPNLKHLSFSLNIHGEGEDEALSDTLDNLRLESLHLESWFPHVPDTFTFLTRSSLATLRSLSFPWNPLEHPVDLSGFTSLCTLELSHLEAVPAADLVLTFSTLPSSLVSLNLLSNQKPPIVDFPHLFQHLPSTLRSLEVPRALAIDELLEVVAALPSHIRYLYTRLSWEEWRSKDGSIRRALGVVEDACHSRGVVFGVQNRLSHN